MMITDPIIPRSTNTTVPPGLPFLASGIDWSRDVNLLCMGIIINLGLVCNLLALLVLVTSSSIRRTGTGSYLIGLAVADTMFLVGDLLRWMHFKRSDWTAYFTEVSLMHNSMVWCKLVYILRYAGKLSSAWITVAITTQRFAMIRNPLKIAVTTSVARIVVAGIGVSSTLLALFPLWTIGIEQHKCSITNRPLYNAMNWAVLRVGSLLLPGVIVVVFTVLILKHLYQTRYNISIDLREEMHPTTLRRKELEERQLTAILLAVALVFLLFRLPYTVAYYLNHFKRDLWGNLDTDTSDVIFDAYIISQVIATANYAVNFFLYCMCGKKFRHELCLFLGCAACRKR